MTIKNLTPENFHDEVLESSTPVIIDFFAEWCGPCKMMAPVFDEVSKDYKGKLKFLKIDTQRQEVLASRFNIRGIPCLIVLKNGKEIGRIVGFMPEESLKEKIDEII